MSRDEIERTMQIFAASFDAALAATCGLFDLTLQLGASATGEERKHDVAGS